jgi:NAD(P)H-flavin reductase
MTLPVLEILPGTPRAHIVRLDLRGGRFVYRAGQALLVAPHGAEQRRPYSLASAPEDAERDGWLELLVGVNGGDQAAADLPLAPGALVDVEGPVGDFTFPDDPEVRRFVFVAGGTGIAPLRAMIRHAIRDPRNQVGLLYSARLPDEFAYEDEFRALTHSGRIEFRQTVTREAPPDIWTGPRGRIRAGVLAPLVHGPDTLCFICGPRALVDDIPKVLDEMGVPRRRVRIEEWGPPAAR